MLKPYVQARGLGLMIAAWALLADVVTKGEILKALVAGKLPQWLVVNQLGFAFSWNTGMSFSLLQGVSWGPYFLSAAACVASVWFVHWMADGGRWHQAGVGLILAGAVGNLLDRLQHGAVVDFIVVSPLQLFPYTFNVADACITLGVGLVLLDGLRNKKEG